MRAIKNGEQKISNITIDFPNNEGKIDMVIHDLNISNSDDKIIAEILDLKNQYMNEEICLITADLGLELKAENHGIKVIPPTDKWMT